jgi:hypothetical protein
MNCALHQPISSVAASSLTATMPGAVVHPRTRCPARFRPRRGWHSRPDADTSYCCLERPPHTRADGDDVLCTTSVHSRRNLLQDSWVACGSHQAARGIEERMDPSDPEENSHEDHSTQCLPAEPATSPLFTSEVSRQPILTPEMSQHFN